MRTIYTIGYEGSDSADFLATLRLLGVRTLVDVRAVPISRKPGFSKTRLANLLAEAGLDYVHLQALGDPKPGREAARAGDLAKFRRIFSKHLENDAAQAQLLQLAKFATESVVCILCFEREHTCCHRSLIADALVTSGQFKIRNVGVRAGLAAIGETKRAALVKELHIGCD
jgi:uncharacterized protein (DUF488 family)